MLINILISTYVETKCLYSVSQTYHPTDGIYTYILLIIFRLIYIGTTELISLANITCTYRCTSIYRFPSYDSVIIIKKKIYKRVQRVRFKKILHCTTCDKLK